jgi:thiol:disulfide interchange protein DsbC
MKKLIIALTIIGLTCSSYATSSAPKQKSSNYLVNKSFLSQQFSITETKDAQVWKYFKDLFPSTVINAIYTTPYKNTYGVLAGQNIFYGTLGSPFIMVGHLFNPYTQQDLTAEIDQMRTQNQKVDIAKINLTDALVTKSPNNPMGKKIIIFEDPDCPYCRVLAKQMQDNKIDSKVDIYRIFLPLPMHENARAHITNIYCTKNNDSLAILNKYMLDGDDKQKVELKDGCDVSKMLERTGKITRDLGINGVPTIVLGNGKMVQGVDTNSILEYVAAPKVISDLKVESNFRGN